MIFYHCLLSIQDSKSAEIIRTMEHIALETTALKFIFRQAKCISFRHLIIINLLLNRYYNGQSAQLASLFGKADLEKFIRWHRQNFDGTVYCKINCLYVLMNTMHKETVNKLEIKYRQLHALFQSFIPLSMKLLLWL